MTERKMSKYMDILTHWCDIQPVDLKLNGCSFFRLSHSARAKSRIISKGIRLHVVGPHNEGENIPSMYCDATAMSGLRKMTHPTMTIINVSHLCGIINHSAWYSPQHTKVQLAPCHKPLRRKTVKILHCLRSVPLRLPPKGMYT